MDVPLISIVVSTYNGARFIAAQIDSLLQQTYRNLEIIVTDDASTDGTAAILSGYASDARFTIQLHADNVGFIKNFERGLRLAKGAYIALCDQDDIWLPEKIEQLYRCIGGYSLAYCDSKLVNEQGDYMGVNVSGIKRMFTGTDARGFLITNMVSGHALMLNREVLQHALPLHTDVFHDEWLTVHAAVLNGIVYLDQPLTLYRQHTANMTRIVLPKHSRSRSLNKRYEALLKKLQWIQQLGSIQREENRLFYTRLYELFELKKQGRFVWPLFIFLLRHQGPLFRHTRKNFFSRFIEIRKLSRGERFRDADAA